MYKIIGADGKEYGPVSEVQLRDWILQGRANGQTRVLAEGATEWRPLAELAAFADTLSGGAPARIIPPLSAPPDPVALGAQILAGDYQLEIGRCFSRGWDLVMSRFWFCVGVSALTMLISMAAGAIPGVGVFVSLALTYVFAGGLHWTFLKLVRGEPAEIGDIFSGFSLAFLPLMLFSLVGQILVGLGFVLCVLPGIYLAVSWLFFTPLLIIDKRLDFWPAMELSRKMVGKHWWVWFGFALMVFLVGLLGTLACIIGVFVASPVISAATAYAYQDTFCAARPGTPMPLPGTPPTQPTPSPQMPA